MAAVERSGTFGYLGLKKETTAGTAVTPNDWVPLYKTSLVTDVNLVLDNPAAGIKFDVFQALPGIRSHKGTMEVMAEPHSAGKFFDMLLNNSSDSGGGDPFTHNFQLNATTPKSYTIDISYGNQVHRYFGVQANKISPKFDKNEMRFEIGIAALGSFTPKRILSTATTIITLDTTLESSPTTGLVASDLIRLYKASDGSILDTTVTSVTANTITTGATVTSFGAGDMVYLRPATPSFNALVFQPFLWSNTQFCFGTTAAAAVSAAQTRLEPGSMWTLEHHFESDDGSPRSGGLDPASLIRLQGGGSFLLKQFFDTPELADQWRQTTSRAVVIRHYTGTANNHELRVTLNSITAKDKVQPDLESNKVLYSEANHVLEYNNTDGQAFDVKVLNADATV